MMRSHQPSLLLGLLLGITVGTACWHQAPNHCANLAGDQTCAERGSGSYCSACVIAKDGCTDERPSDECYFEGPFEATSTSGAEATSSEATTLELTADSSSGFTTGPQVCVSDEECGGATPFCGMTGVCAGCDETRDGGAACAGLDPASPICAGGECVQCTAAATDACSGKTPVCDDASNACVACTEHEECGEAACNFYTGACLPAEAVVHVGPGLDFTDISAAANSFGIGEEGTIIVHAGSYQADVAVSEGQTLAFLAAPESSRPVWADEDMAIDPHLLVFGEGSTVFVDSITFSENINSTALRIIGGRAWVDRSRIVNNGGGGVLVENGADVTIRNSFVGDSVDDANALEVFDASATVLYSTLAAGTVTAVALSCTNPTAVVVRNSLLVSQGNAGTGGIDVACTSADITFTATESMVAGEGNQMVGQMPPTTPGDWFVNFGNGDFHLQNEGLTLFAGIAEWQAGDPRTDIDGDLRPTTDGTSDYAGADLP